MNNILNIIILVTNYLMIIECMSLQDEDGPPLDLSGMGLDEVAKKKCKQMFDIIASLPPEDNDATVDRTNTPIFPTLDPNDVMLKKKLDACQDYIATAGYDNHFMVNDLITHGHLRSVRVDKAMREVDKDEFAPINPLNKNHFDYPVDIGHGTWMEPPYQVAGTLEHLKKWLTPSSKILEIGAGTGYMSTLFSLMGGHVYAMEHVPELARNIKDKQLMGAPRVYYWDKVHVICEDGRNGYPKEAPYDIIYISASYDDVPWNIVAQLKPGGRMVFVHHRHPKTDKQALVVFDKNETGECVLDAIHASVYLPPLKDLQSQLKSNPYNASRRLVTNQWFTGDYDSKCYFDKKEKETRDFSLDPTSHADLYQYGYKSPLWRSGEED